MAATTLGLHKRKKMANAIEINEFTDSVRLIEPGDRVIGGEDAPINQPLKSLANRTKYLKSQVELTRQQLGNSAKNSVKLEGDQTIGGAKNFSGEVNFYKGITVSDSQELHGRDTFMHIGASATSAYLRNRKSGKILELKNDGIIQYDGSEVLTVRKVSHSPTDYTVATIPSSFALNKVFSDTIKRGGSIGLGGASHNIAIGWDTPGLVAKVDNNIVNVGVPTGAIAYFCHAAVPFGWLKANGAAVSRTVYANLFAAIGTTYGAGDGRTTFNIPDLRGEFIRTWDDGRGIDPGRGHASQQSGNVASHRHATGWRTGVVGNEFTLIRHDWTGSSNVVSDVSIGTGAQNYGDLDPYGQVAGTAYRNSNDFYGTSREIYEQQGETRPRNIALMACIKA